MRLLKWFFINKGKGFLMIEFVCNCGQFNRVCECFSIYVCGIGSIGIFYECIKCGDIILVN